MKTIAKIILPLLFLTLAVMGAKKLVASRKPPEKREVKTAIPQVETLRVSPATHHPVIESFGTLSPYDQARLMPELSARVVWVNEKFRVGERVTEGQVLVRLERRDFEAALEREKANLAELERQLAEETVRAEQAAADWVASGRPLEQASDFRLRKPQLAALDAQLKSAAAAIGTAELNLVRTEIHAPFDSLVMSREVNLGELASPQNAMGTLTAIDRAEVRLPLTAEQIARLGTELSADTLARDPLEVQLRLPDQKGSRPAYVRRLDPSIDARNQVRYLIAEVPSPFASHPFALAIGSFVKAHLAARPVPSSLRLPESALVEDRYLWTVDATQKLARLPVTRVATLDGDVIVRSEAPHAKELRVVTRPLTTFRPGMRVAPPSETPEAKP